MNVQLVGISYHETPVEVLERLAFIEDRAAEISRDLTRDGALNGIVVLSTCHRVYVLASGERDALRKAFFRWLRGPGGGLPVPEDDFDSRDGRDAIQKVFRVASSLDSMFPGETEILGQVKDAYQRAKNVGTLGNDLDQLLSSAFHVAKRVRNETEIGKMAVSVSSVAVELARKIFGDLEGRSALLVGAGKMAETAARHLRGAGVSQLLVANRTLERAERLAASFQAEPASFDRLLELLQQVDIVISSTGAPDRILSKQTAEGVIAARRNRPIFFVDIAVPRDIDPAINDIDNMFVYDIDDLKQVTDANMQHRQAEAERAEPIVEDEVERFLQRFEMDGAAPAIASINERLESIRQGELERFGSKLRELSDEQREAVEALTRGIVKKVAHHPIREVKRAASSSKSAITVDDIRRLFGLE